MALMNSGIITRLFYWQIVQGTSLRKAVENQSTQEKTFRGKRGQIFTADNHLLVGNTQLYHLMVDKSLLENSAESVAGKLAPILAEQELKESTDTSQIDFK